MTLVNVLLHTHAVTSFCEQSVTRTASPRVSIVMLNCCIWCISSRSGPPGEAPSVRVLPRCKKYILLFWRRLNFEKYHASTPHSCRRVPNVGSPNLRNSFDFFSDTRSDPDADAAVHPLRPADGQCAPHRHCGAHCLGAVSNRHRAEK